MIIREWRGWVSSDRGDLYPTHFRATVMPQLAGIPGFLGADLCQRVLDGRIEFTVFSRWESMAAVHAFAGPVPAKAVIEPGAVAALDTYDREVSHHEVLEQAVPQLRP